MTDQQAETIARLLAELMREVGENRKTLNRIEDIVRSRQSLPPLPVTRPF